MRESLKSKWALWSAMVLPLLLVLLWLFAVYSIIDDLTKNGGVGKFISLCLPLGIGLYSIIDILYVSRTYPFLNINQQGIRLVSIFSTRFITWSDIESIQITGQANADVLSSAAEVTTLHLKNQEKLLLLAKYYGNRHQIRAALTYMQEQNFSPQAFDLEKMKLPRVPKNHALSRDKSFQKYRRFFFMSQLGFVFCFVFFIASFVCITSLYQQKIPAFFTFFMLFVIPFAAINPYFHYFYLDEKYLIVKHDILIFKKQVFRLEDIYELVVENRYSGYMLQVITKDYRSHNYYSAALKREDWIRMMEQIEELPVPLRDEIGFKSHLIADDDDDDE